jgi:hypothetical protein
MPTYSLFTPFFNGLFIHIKFTSCRFFAQGTIFNKCSQIMAYADDIVIMGRRIQDVKEMFTVLIEQTNKL